MEPVIQTQNLHKVYGETVAVNDVSLTVQRGEIFGILGPNGAGKTTTVEMIMGLRTPDGGDVQVLGLSPHKQHAELLPRIGIQLQEAALAERMKVWEALDLFSSFYEDPLPWEPLLEQWGLADKRNTAFVKLSGGQKQRLFIALALLNDPEVVFLDELTTGLDPQARRATWDLVKEIKAQGKTVVLVTHFMDEAEYLCDRLAIIDHGEIIALDSPANLIRGLGRGQRIVFEANGNFPIDAVRQLGSVSQIERSGDRVEVYGDSADLITDVVITLQKHRATFSGLHTEQPDLEDVFLSLTGRTIRA
ncbi:MAG: ABC transporter ATP-binding protein [Caldilineales bacterium]|nr:ABC transporter ATP-binding protein [Caldilineales bacterium]